MSIWQPYDKKKSTHNKILQKAGLGFKRVKLDLEDNENQVYEKLVSDDLDE